MLARISSNVSRSRQAIFSRLYSESRLQHNQAIIELLSKHKAEEQNKANPNSFKVTAFSKAIQAVSQYHQPINSGKDLLELRGIGSGIAARINEYLLEQEEVNEGKPIPSFPWCSPDGAYAALYQELRREQALSALSNVPGIGSVTAKKLVDAGCHSLADLKSGKFSSFLSVRQIAKIKYADHLECPVQRPSAEEVLDFCRDSLDPPYELSLVGDYRRGLPSFSDIHIMMSHPDFVFVPFPSEQNPDELSDTPKKRSRGRKKKDEKSSLLISDAVPLLEQRGLIAETLSSNTKTWEGIVRLPGQRDSWGDRLDRISAINNVEGNFRKVILHLVPQKSRGSSLICLTGDAEFEKDIRYRASQRDLLFNEYGLWRWTPNPTPDSPKSDSASQPFGVDYDTAATQKAGYWSLLNSATEEDIFRELGMDFVDPTRRNLSYVTGRKRKTRTSS